MNDTTDIFSPDKNFKLHFYGGIEPHMCMEMSKFLFTDLRTKEKIKLKPLLTNGYKGHTLSWSECSRFYSLAIVHPLNCFFIYDTQIRKFATILFKNVWVLEGHCFNDHVEIEFRDDQIPVKMEHNTYFSKNFSKPPNLTFTYDTLTWHSIDHIRRNKSLLSTGVVYDLKPIGSRKP